MKFSCLILILVSPLLLVGAEPDQCRNAFLLRNPELKEKITLFALTSIDREIEAAKIDQMRAFDVWRSNLMLGKPAPGKTIEEIKKKAEQSYQLDIQGLKAISSVMKSDSYLFMISIDGALGLIVLSPEATVMSRLIQTVDQNIKLK